MEAIKVILENEHGNTITMVTREVNSYEPLAYYDLDNCGYADALIGLLKSDGYSNATIANYLFDAAVNLMPDNLSADEKREYFQNLDDITD